MLLSILWLVGLAGWLAYCGIVPRHLSKLIRDRWPLAKPGFEWIWWPS